MLVQVSLFIRSLLRQMSRVKDMLRAPGTVCLLGFVGRSQSRHGSWQGVVLNPGPYPERSLRCTDCTSIPKAAGLIQRSLSKRPTISF